MKDYVGMGNINAPTHKTQKLSEQVDRENRAKSV